MQHQKLSSPPLIFCAAASSDETWLAQWEKHLLPLQQAGRLTVWSEKHLLAGSPRAEQIDVHLQQAQLICLLLSADFFASEECNVLMQRSLQRQQEGTTRVFSLLLRPVTWQETPLVALALLPSNEVPVTGWEDPEQAFQDCVQGVLRMLGRFTPASSRSQPRHAMTRQQRNREAALRRLRHSYDKQMQQSLQGAAWLELGLAEKPDAVQNPVSFLWHSPSQAELPLPPGTSILQAYDKAIQELLILGEPGTGKSTLLLDLARQLVQRAEHDEACPLPVILPLSSWAVKRPPLQNWIAEQLSQIYDIRYPLNEQWVREESILPLLDGLDEMEEAARPACIAAINRYHQAYLLVPPVVCSRKTEYEAAARQQRLTLQEAVVVQLLTHEQVDSHLLQAGKPLEALHSALKKNADLRDLATTPLMLSVLMLTYQETSVRELSSKGEQLRERIWTDYVRRMVECKKDGTRYPLDVTRAWLGWLARRMRQHGQTVFHLELMQPDWLPKKQKIWYRWSVGLLFGLPVALLAALVIGLISGVPGGALFGALLFGLPTALLAGQKVKIEPVELLTFSWRALGSQLLMGLGWGLLFGVIGGLVAGPEFGVIGGLVFGLLVGLPSALFIWLLSGLFVGISGAQLTERLIDAPNEGMRNSVKNGVRLALLGALLGALPGVLHTVPIVGYILTVLFAGPLGLLLAMRRNAKDLRISVKNGILVALVIGLIGTAIGGLRVALLDGLLAGLLAGLIAGLGAAVQHYTLRFWLWRNRAFPYRVVPFLENATTRIFLRRVGSGYSFAHRMLLEHFAATAPMTAEPLVEFEAMNVLERLAPKVEYIARAKALSYILAVEVATDDTDKIKALEATLEPEQRNQYNLFVTIFQRTYQDYMAHHEYS